MRLTIGHRNRNINWIFSNLFWMFFFNYFSLIVYHLCENPLFTKFSYVYFMNYIIINYYAFLIYNHKIEWIYYWQWPPGTHNTLHMSNIHQIHSFEQLTERSLKHIKTSERNVKPLICSYLFILASHARKHMEIKC